MVRPPASILRPAILAWIFAAASAPLSAASVEQQIRMALGIYSKIIVELSNAGYSDIRMLDWQKNRLIARDPGGSRVVVVLDSNATKVKSTEYVHMADR